MSFGDDVAFIACPWCAEPIELYVDPDTSGAIEEDCEICCRPWRVVVTREDGELSVSVDRA